MGYRKNRERVFDIYAIDLNNPEYDCHHIVTREDVKTGLVSKDFNLNAISNLYPIKVLDHKQINKRLYLLEKKTPEVSIRFDLESTLISKHSQNEIINVSIIDLRFLSFIQQRNVQEKSTPLKFLVWKRKGIL